MAKRANVVPALARFVGSADPLSMSQFLERQGAALYQEFVEHAQRSNATLPMDGTEPMTGPLVLASYEVSALPDAATYARGMIYVSDETGGAVPAFSDGTNWRRVTDRAIVS